MYTCVLCTGERVAPDVCCERERERERESWYGYIPLSLRRVNNIYGGERELMRAHGKRDGHRNAGSSDWKTGYVWRLCAYL